MGKIGIAVGLAIGVLVAGCQWGGTPPIPVVRVDDDSFDNTLAAPQVVVPALTFDQHIRLVGTVSQGPGVFDVFHIDFPADGDYRIAFDCTASANLEIDIYDNQQAFVPPARTCGPGHLTSIVSGAGFYLEVSNNTIGSVEASYDLTLELVEVP